MLEKDIITKNLDQLYRESPVRSLSEDDRVVVFSDLHMGDGSGRDDFLFNADLFAYVLENQYLNHGYTLILNGDVEELQRFAYPPIRQRWQRVYALFDAFAGRERLVKIIGNHDYSLILKSNRLSPYPHLNALVLKYRDNHLFVFHGHQASLYYTRHNALIGFFLRYVANPLGIRNYSVAHDSRKQYQIEKRVYEYSSRRKVASLIGHTHRPLFESLSKRDYLLYEIERLARGFATEPASANAETGKKLRFYKEELTKLNRNPKKSLLSSSLYNDGVLVPCLFNSGCVIGKRGITCLEITRGEIALVHYFDQRVKSARLEEGQPARPMGDSPYYRLVINQEPLDYIFTRIRFLT
ncbi:MAG: metallophosphoesterase [Ferruginibacter sp.]|nr:metallophosphoesterase [Cytophagales bacterium]